MILSTQRSGSTYLRDWLNLHPDIRCHDEVFMSYHANSESFASYLSLHRLAGSLEHKFRAEMNLSGLFARFWVKKFLLNLLSDRPFALPSADRQINESFTPKDFRCKAKWVGLKAQANQLLKIEGIAPLMKTLGVHVITLRRENLLEILVSRKVAKMRNVFHSDQPSIINERLHICPQEMLNELNAIAHKLVAAQALFSDCPNHQLTYESLFNPSNTEREYSRIIEFLGLPIVPSEKPALSKQVTLPFSDLIENYEELVAALRQHGYDERGKPLEAY